MATYAIRIFISLILVALTVPSAALADSVQTFRFKNSGIEQVNSLTVTFDTPVRFGTPQAPTKGTTFTPPATQTGTFTGVAPGEGGGGPSKTASFTSPMTTGVPPMALTVNQNDYVDIQIHFQDGKAGKPTSFTWDIDGVPVPATNTPKLLGPNAKVTGDPQLQFSGDIVGGEFFFLTDIKVWTNLTEAEALDFPTTFGTPPDITAAQISLAPGASAGLDLGAVVPDSFVLASFNFLTGPTADISQTTTNGPFVFAEVKSVPEPSMLVFVASGLAGLAGATWRRRRR